MKKLMTIMMAKRRVRSRGVGWCLERGGGRKRTALISGTGL